jgi:hypothetical protein
MRRSIAAVLAGYISIGILVVLTDKAVAGMNPGDWSPGHPVPTHYFVVSLFTAPLYSVFGGWLCALIAKVKARHCILGLIVFGEIMGVASAVMTWSAAPHWYTLGLLVLYPPCVFLGGWLYSRTGMRKALNSHFA